jgi:hypothetical protein
MPTVVLTNWANCISVPIWYTLKLSLQVFTRPSMALTVLRKPWSWWAQHYRKAQNGSWYPWWYHWGASLEPCGQFCKHPDPVVCYKDWALSLPVIFRVLPLIYVCKCWTVMFRVNQLANCQTYFGCVDSWPCMWKIVVVGPVHWIGWNGCKSNLPKIYWDNWREILNTGKSQGASQIASAANNWI